MSNMPIDRPPPTIDPTTLTTEALLRAIAAERDYVDGKVAVLLERLRGIDHATEIVEEAQKLSSSVIDEKVSHLQTLHDEKFESIALQFRERDERAARESRDNKLAVDAAFAASEKQADARSESSALAISKSESATVETIKTNAELAKKTDDSLAQQLGDLKERIFRIEARREGAAETRTEQRATISSTGTIVSIAVAVVGSFALFFGLNHYSQTQPQGNDLTSRVTVLEQGNTSLQLRVGAIETLDKFFCSSRAPTLPSC